MGNCTSYDHCSKKTNGGLNCTSTVKIVHIDGRLQEFKQPIKASYVLSLNPNCFLCCSETMHLESLVPQVSYDEELQIGQLYFLMPQSKCNAPLSLQDMCALAIKASAVVLAQSENKPYYVSKQDLSVSDKNDSNFLVKYQRCCHIPASSDILAKSFSVMGRRNHQFR